VIDFMEDEILCVHCSFTFFCARLIYVRETKLSAYDLFDENNHAHETLLLEKASVWLANGVVIARFCTRVARIALIKLSITISTFTNQSHTVLTNATWNRGASKVVRFQAENANIVAFITLKDTSYGSFNTG
jgi:hypothetical protein